MLGLNQDSSVANHLGIFFLAAAAVRQGEAEQLQDEWGGWECWMKGVVLENG